jgi:hypothetical protein
MNSHFGSIGSSAAALGAAPTIDTVAATAMSANTHPLKFLISSPSP